MNDFYNPEYDGPVGIYQNFRSCYDIKIVSNPAQASSVSYKPNPVKPRKNIHQDYLHVKHFHLLPMLLIFIMFQIRTDQVQDGNYLSIQT